LGRDPSTITRILAGDRPLKINEVDRVSEYLGENPPDLKSSETSASRHYARESAQWELEPFDDLAVSLVMREAPHEIKANSVERIDIITNGMRAMISTAAKAGQPLTPDESVKFAVGLVKAAKK